MFINEMTRDNIRHSKRVYFCQRCLNHGARNQKRNHKTHCPFFTCACPKCILIKKRHELNTRLSTLMQVEVDIEPRGGGDNGQQGGGGIHAANYERVPSCQKCGQHGMRARLKGHKGECPFKDCECPKCSVISERQKLMAKQIKIRRQQRKELGGGRSGNKGGIKGGEKGEGGGGEEEEEEEVALGNMPKASSWPDINGRRQMRLDDDDVHFPMGPLLQPSMSPPMAPSSAISSNSFQFHRPPHPLALKEQQSPFLLSQLLHHNVAAPPLLPTPMPPQFMMSSAAALVPGAGDPFRLPTTTFSDHFQMLQQKLILQLLISSSSSSPSNFSSH